MFLPCTKSVLVNFGVYKGITYSSCYCFLIPLILPYLNIFSNMLLLNSSPLVFDCLPLRLFPRLGSTYFFVGKVVLSSSIDRLIASSSSPSTNLLNLMICSSLYPACERSDVFLALRASSFCCSIVSFACSYSCLYSFCSSSFLRFASSCSFSIRSSFSFNALTSATLDLKRSYGILLSTCCSCSSVFFVSSDVLTATSLFVVTSSTCSVCSFLISLSINDSPLFYAHRRNVLRSISYSLTTSRSIVLRFFSAF